MYATSADVLTRTVGFHLNRGVLAAADRAPEPAPGPLLAAARRVLVLEGVNDHENLGALFRNAAGARGRRACCSGRAAPTRSTAGRCGSRWATCCGSRSSGCRPGRSCAAALAGFTVLALAPHPPSVPLSTVDPSAPRLALLLGAEGPGLTAEALAAADTRVRIPMAAGVDSLNVATAAAIALYHLRPEAG